MKNRLLSAVIAATLAATLSAFAANTTFFTNIGDLVFPFSPPARTGTPGTIDNMTIGATTPANGTFSTVTADRVVAAFGNYAKNPASTTYYPAYSFGTGVSQMTFATAAGATSYAYVTLATAPKDGQSACIYSQQAITALTLVVASQSINNAVATLAAAARVCYLYSLANTTWDRSQ